MTLALAKAKNRRSRRLRMLTPAAAGAAAALLALAGCDDTHQADRRVLQTVAEARIERAKGEDASAQEKLKQAAGEANAAHATRAHAKGVLAQAQYDAALNDIADPVTGIDAGNREILRLMWEINQLGNQVAAGNSLVAVYRQMEPKETRAAVQQTILQATGERAGSDWVGQGAGAVPTLATVQQQVQQQQAAVDQQQELIKQLQAQQEQLSVQAQQAASQAEAAPGRAGLDIFKQAVGLRKQVADLVNRVEVEQSKLAQLEHNLKLAQARQQAVATAIEQFKKFGGLVEQEWKGVESQAVRLQQLSTAIVQGGDSKVASSIAEKAKTLSAQIATNKEAYEQASQNLTDSAENFGQAVSAANQLRSEMMSKESALPSGNQMKAALKTLIDVYNPATFQIGQASSHLALANLQVSRAQALAERAQLVDRLSKVMSQAGLTLPAEMNDPGLGAAVKEMSEQANSNFAAATELFSTVMDAGAAAESVRNGGRAGKIYALYGQALLARATGGNADQLLATARSERDLALQESPTALAALPAELVPPPSTQPAAAPTTPAATTPAPAPEGAPPAEGAPPLEAPATPPADGTAPATPATPPADGAAPATPPADGAEPATPPADGAAPADAAPATPGTDTAAPAPQ